jgi:cyclopropane fatty-acyl-phospholipid synthase-like methyltransferase
LADPADPHLTRWNQRFGAADYVFGTAPNAFLAAEAHRLKPGMTALAIADGEGRNGVFLARQGLAVLSVDFSPVGQAKTRQLAAQYGVSLATECADLAEWQWGRARFDVVVGIFFQIAAPELRARLFAGMRDTLRPGGLVLIQGYRPEQLAYGTGGPKDTNLLYTADMLRAAFAGFEILHLREHDSEIHEGGGHDGMSALVDLVARKPARK